MIERVVCTIVTKSHLAYARTLAETLYEHNPNSTLYVLLADRNDDDFDPKLEPFELIELDDLPDPDLVEKMCFYYTPFELCCALRGHLHEYMLENTDAESWIFLDSDIMVCHSLDKIFQHLAGVSLLLTPHSRLPVEIQDANPHELNLLRSGISNAGFMGLRRTKETARFIRWFKARLIHYCFNDPELGDPRGLFVDQLWLNLALIYFRGVDFVTEPGANIGHWNLWEKKLGTAYDGKITIDNAPLLFIHFSGWNIHNPDQVSQYNPLYQDYTDPLWQELAATYREKLLQNDFETTSQLPYAFSCFENGDRITQNMRRAYYNDVMNGTAAESPFTQVEYFQANTYIAPTIEGLTEALENSQRQLTQLHKDAESVHQTLVQTQEDLVLSQQQLKNTDELLQHTQDALERTHTELVRNQDQVQRLHQHIAAMESTKIWQLRLAWVRWKQRFLGRRAE